MTKRIMRTFKMDEISAVDFPAQVGARATILKRDFSQDQRDHLASTGAALPDGSFPIQNGGDLENAIHAVGRAKDSARAKAHIIARAKSLGLTSKLPDDWVTKQREVEDMTADEVTKLLEDAVAKAVAPVASELALLKATKKDKKKPMDDSMDDGMDEPDADDAQKAAWRKHTAKAVAKAVAERNEYFAKQAELAKADETFESEGIVIRKSEIGEGAFKLMKAQAEKLEIASFEKRAQSEISHLPGELGMKAKALRAISKMDEEIRAAVEAMLKGGSAALRDMSKAKGAHIVEATSAEGQLNAAVDAYAKAQNVDKANAYDAVLRTTEGAALYNQMSVEKRASRLAS